jgi:hypothetical protein
MVGKARRKDQTAGVSPFFLSYVGKIEKAGQTQVLFDHLVSTGTTIDLYQLFVICRFHGKFVVKLDDEVIGSGRTGPAGYPYFSWYPVKRVLGGKRIKLEFTSRTGFPDDIVDLEAYLQASTV